MARKLSEKEFVERAIQKHGALYDYTNTVYVTSRDKVEITCKQHGKFYQLPHQHLAGKGCLKCGNIKKGISKTKTTKEFIDEAIKIHGNKYDYSKVSYINNATKVLITCKVHGDFEQAPKYHTCQGSGCTKCADLNTANINRLSIDMFLKRSRKWHGNKYDYSKVSYYQLKDKITIICQEHGEFKQTAASHIEGHGCPKCATRGFDKNKHGWLYLVYLIDYDLYKIGITNRGIEQRLAKENYDILFSKYYEFGFDAFIQEQIFIRNNTHLLYKGNKVMHNNGDTELFKLYDTKDEHGKQMKPEGWTGPEPELQALIDRRYKK